MDEPKTKPKRNDQEPFKRPDEERSILREEAEPRTDTNWDEWQENESEWRRAGGGEQPPKPNES